MDLLSEECWRFAVQRTAQAVPAPRMKERISSDLPPRRAAYTAVVNCPCVIHQTGPPTCLLYESVHLSAEHNTTLSQSILIGVQYGVHSCL